MSDTITYHKFTAERGSFLLSVYPGARAIGLVLRGDTPHVVVYQPHQNLKFTGTEEQFESAVSLRLLVVAAGDRVPEGSDYLGSFSSTGLYSVLVLA